jgi:hypothetical protein
MKKSAVLFMALLFVLSVVQGQTKQTDKKEMKKERVALKKLEGSNVSVTAKNSFNVDFGKVSNVKWLREGVFDEATFTKDGIVMKAFYDIEGKLVGTTQTKTFADVPANGQKEIKTRYKDYTIGPVIFFDDNEANETDMVLYGVQFEDEDNYFVELTKGAKKIVVQVNNEGTFFFKEL